MVRFCLILLLLSGCGATAREDLRLLLEKEGNPTTWTFDENPAQIVAALHKSRVVNLNHWKLTLPDDIKPPGKGSLNEVLVPDVYVIALGKQEKSQVIARLHVDISRTETGGSRVHVTSETLELRQKHQLCYKWGNPLDPEAPFACCGFGCLWIFQIPSFSCCSSSEPTPPFRTEWRQTQKPLPSSTVPEYEYLYALGQALGETMPPVRRPKIRIP